MATVFLAEWCGAVVAAKCIRQNPDANLRQEFVAETATMSKLRHPNIVQLLAASFEPNLQLILEYCALGSLFDSLAKIREEGPESLPWLNEDRKPIMALDIARGLMYLHTRSPPLVHRDIKSLNVLITAHYTCKLADFGLSTVSPESALIGSLAYLAPEVLLGEPASLKTDIYALALTFWELFSEEEIFPDFQFAKDIANAVLDRNIRPPLASIPVEYVDLISSCWDTLPENRPPADVVYTYLSQLISLSNPLSSTESDTFS